MSTEIENHNVAALLRQVDGLVQRLSKCEVERDDLRAQVERLHADGAAMRGACQSALSALDVLMGDTDLDSDDSDEMKACQKLAKALEASCGADLLARYLEAVDLLRQNKRYGDRTRDWEWLKRRDTLLATVKGDL